MTQHINPGTDTTINPVVIDDSKRERKKDPKGTQYDSGSGHIWTKIPPQRYIIDADYIEKLDEWLSEHEIDELQRMQIRARLKLEPIEENHCDKCDHWDICEGCPYTEDRATNTPAHPPEAQQRIGDAVIQLMGAMQYNRDGSQTGVEHSIMNAIALLQAGDPK